MMRKLENELKRPPTYTKRPPKTQRIRKLYKMPFPKCIPLLSEDGGYTKFNKIFVLKFPRTFNFQRGRNCKCTSKHN